MTDDKMKTFMLIMLVLTFFFLGMFFTVTDVGLSNIELAKDMQRLKGFCDGNNGTHTLLSGRVVVHCDEPQMVVVFT